MKARFLLPSLIAFLTLAFPLSGPAGAQGSDVRVVSGIPYSSSGTRLTMDALLPTAGGTRAAVVVIPGGGWSPAPGQEGDLPRVIAEAGFAVFVPTYTPIIQAPFPSQISDLEDAIQYIRDHAAEYDVDPARIAALGGSAGGHLAAVLATAGTGPLDQGSRIRVAVSWSGPMDLNLLFESGTRIGTLYRLLGCSTIEECQDEAQEASPVTFVDGQDPPIFLANSLAERIPSDQAEAMADALDAAAVPHELVEIEGQVHGTQFVKNDQVLQASLDFLRTWLGVNDDGELQALPDIRPSPGTIVSPDGVSPSGEREDGRTSAGRPSAPSSTFPWLFAAVAVLAAAAVIITLWLVRVMRQQS